MAKNGSSINTISLASVTDTGVDVTSNAVCANDYNSLAFQINVAKNAGSTSSPTGSIYLQSSINYDDWVTVPDSTFDISSFSSKIIEYQQPCALYYRVKLDLTSAPVAATGTITGSVGVLDIAANDTGEDGNSIQVVLANTATAGSETVSVVGTIITVGIESGVSTCAQIIAAIEADVDAVALVALTETTPGAMEFDSVTLTGGDSYSADFSVWSTFKRT